MYVCMYISTTLTSTKDLKDLGVTSSKRHRRKRRKRSTTASVGTRYT